MQPPHAIHSCIHSHARNKLRHAKSAYPTSIHPPTATRSINGSICTACTPPPSTTSSINNSISPSPPKLNTPQQPTHHLHRTPQASTACIDLPTSHPPTRPPSITPSATSKQPTRPSTMPCHVLPHPHDPAPLCNSTFVLLPPPPPLSAIPPETPFVEQERRSALDIWQRFIFLRPIPPASLSLFVWRSLFVWACAGREPEVPGQLGPDQNAAHGHTGLPV